MSAVYAAMDALLPFEWLHYTFMKNALLALLLTSGRSREPESLAKPYIRGGR